MEEINREARGLIGFNFECLHSYRKASNPVRV